MVADSYKDTRMSIAIIVHGGAWAIPDDQVDPHRAGCRAARDAGWSVLANGGSAMDAVEAAVRILEDDPTYDAGVGSILNRGGFVELDADGKLVWEFKPPSTTVIFQVLANGNIVFGYGGQPTGVREITSRGETVFDYVSKSHQVFGCERLANGNTLVAEQEPCQAVEVNPKGEIVHVTPLTTNVKGFHLQVRNVHKLANSNILAAHEGEGAVREVDPQGKVVWEYTGVTNTGEAQRLANGNTLICCGTQKRLIEVTPDKQIAWEFKAEDAPELNITWVSSVQQLKNGNLLVGNFLQIGRAHV